MKIVKLDINPDIDLAGVDAVALVEKPAIEEEFLYFSKQTDEEFAETYTDYPQGAVDAAKMGIKRNKEIDNKCATQVGKVRAQQLANREPISLDTVRRMRSFLIRQKGNYELAQERKDYYACGYISYLLWGGPEALPWAEKVLRQAEGNNEFDLDEACQPGYKALGTKTKNGRTVPNCIPVDQFEEQFAVYVKEEIIKAEMQKIMDIQHEILDLTTDQSQTTTPHAEAFAALDEQQIVIGPLMKPNMLIPRMDENGDPYHVYFTAETIKKIAYKMVKDKLIDRVNIEHDNKESVDAYLVESWIIDGVNDKSKNYGFNLPEGTWMGMYKIDNTRIWEDYVKTGLVKGFSVEGFFEQYAMSKTKCRKNGGCACGRTENPNGLCDGSHLK